MNVLAYTLKRLWNTPPRQVFGALRRRLSRHNTRVIYDLEEIFSAPKHTRSQRPYDFLHRYQAIIHRHHPEWIEIDFAGKRVLESGCGPMLGWGPLAVYLGCDHFTGVEPMFNSAVFDHPQWSGRYLLNFYRDAAALFGYRMDFDRFLQQVRERVTVLPTTHLSASWSEPFDIWLSNSVLEHVEPLAETLLQLGTLAAPGCRFLHAVDFGNHRATKHPFDDLYTMPPATYRQRFGTQINLYRCNDVQRFLQDAGFQTQLTPYYDAREFFTASISPWWRQRYDEAALFLKVGLFHGVR
ncbi:MAG: methyltransferase domain-containing protein [Magnetococcales bacterium]|nr:methyltransferase domain-containing protein [Magnetococcales bacterium]